MLNTTEQTKTARLKQINVEMFTGTLHVLSQVLTSSIERAHLTTDGREDVTAAATSIIKVAEAVHTDHLQEIVESLEQNHKVCLADLLARARNILTSTPSAPLEG